MRTLIATLLLVATTSAASAYCVSVPDDKSTAYFQNGLKKTVCLINEISKETKQRALEVDVNTALDKLDRSVVSSKLDAIKPVEIPTYTAPKLAWP